MKTIIILHGWQSSKEKWQKIKELLENRGLKVITLDLPGFKAETKLKKVWNLDDYLNWVDSFIENCRETPFLLGHSFGGRIALKYSFKKPSKVKGLFLVSSAGIRPPKKIVYRVFEKGAWLIRKLKIEEIPLIKNIWFLARKFFYYFILRRKDYFKTSGFLKATIKNIIKEDLSPILGEIKVPVYIIWGKNDLITPLSDAYLMNEKIKHSRLKILKKIGHTPHLEAPQLLADSIVSFL